MAIATGTFLVCPRTVRRRLAGDVDRGQVGDPRHELVGQRLEGGVRVGRRIHAVRDVGHQLGPGRRLLRPGLPADVDRGHHHAVERWTVAERGDDVLQQHVASRDVADPHVTSGYDDRNTGAEHLVQDGQAPAAQLREGVHQWLTELAGAEQPSRRDVLVHQHVRRAPGHRDQGRRGVPGLAQRSERLGKGQGR